MFEKYLQVKIMKKFLVLAACLLTNMNAVASGDGIASRSLKAPEDQTFVVQNEDRVETLEREMQTLLGRVEVLEHAISQLRSDQSSKPQRPYPDTRTSENIDALDQAPTQLPKVSESSSVSSTPQKTLSSSVEGLEKKNYDAALLALKDSKYEDAEEKFASFILQYPKSSMLSNAYFWHGETYFRRNNFEKAAISYLKGYKQFPKAAKASDSLLKLALSLGAMKKTKEACSMLSKLDAEFKDRPANSIKRASDAKNKYGCGK